MSVASGLTSRRLSATEPVNRCASWDTSRTAGRAPERAEASSTPPIRTPPKTGASAPATTRARDDLPEPDAPTSTVVEPAGRWRSTSSRARRVPTCPGIGEHETIDLDRGIGDLPADRHGADGLQDSDQAFESCLRPLEIIDAGQQMRRWARRADGRTRRRPSRHPRVIMPESTRQYPVASTAARPMNSAVFSPAKKWLRTVACRSWVATASRLRSAMRRRRDSARSWARTVPAPATVSRRAWPLPASWWRMSTYSGRDRPEEPEGRERLQRNGEQRCDGQPGVESGQAHCRQDDGEERADHARQHPGDGVGDRLDVSGHPRDDVGAARCPRRFPRRGSGLPRTPLPEARREHPADMPPAASRPTRRPRPRGGPRRAPRDIRGRGGRRPPSSITRSTIRPSAGGMSRAEAAPSSSGTVRGQQGPAAAGQQPSDRARQWRAGRRRAQAEGSGAEIGQWTGPSGGLFMGRPRRGARPGPRPCGHRARERKRRGAGARP